MATSLPPLLHALLRSEGRSMPNAMEMEEIGMPIGQPFSNQAPYQPRGPTMDPSLGMLSALISGLGGPMGAAPPMQPDPRTLFMRTSVTPNDPMTPVSHGAYLGPEGDESAFMAARAAGGTMASPKDINAARAAQFRDGEGLGIADLEKHAAWKQDMASDEAKRRGLVNQRAMQQGQARSFRQSGMHPQIAALLSAVGADSELGSMALADSISGRGTGLKMREQDLTNALLKRELELKSEMESARSGGTAPLDLRTNAAKIYAEKLERNRGNKAKAAQEALLDVMKTGVTEAEAKTIIAEVAGIGSEDMSPAGAPQKQGPLVGPYGALMREPGVGDVMGAIMDNIRNWDFWKTGMM